MRMMALPLIASLFFAACDSGTASDPVATPTGVVAETPLPYEVPLRSDAELASAIDSLCAASVARSKPALVEFSASWCGDCRKLHEMKQDASLSRELEEWPRLNVNVGRFDRHRALLSALDVDSIAHWAVLEPADCQDPIATWRRLAERTLEVSSGKARNLTPNDLALWLRELRAG